MYLESLDAEGLKIILRYTSAKILLSTVDKERILWANSAFCNWIKYTQSELTEMTWSEISVPGEGLESDRAEANLLNGYQPSYTIRKQFIPKGSKPEWGDLQVLRYPLVGDIKFCVCTWEPLVNGTAESFKYTIDIVKKYEASFMSLAEEIRKTNTQTEEDKVLLGIVRLIKAHPKVALAILLCILSVFGLNNIVQLLQGTGFIPAPTRQVEIKQHP